jgi:YVTN family beta-propeller protein
MRRFRSVRVVVVLGLAGALVVTGGVSAVAARSRCRATAFVNNFSSGTVSTIDVKTRKKDLTDIPVGPAPLGVAVTPDGKTAFVTDATGTVSTIDIRTRKKDSTDITGFSGPEAVAFTPDGKTAFVANYGAFTSLSEAVDAITELSPGSVGTVSTIDVKTRTKSPDDIAVGALPLGVAVTPDGKTAFVTNLRSGTVSTIDVKTRTKDPTDITVGPYPAVVKVTPDGKTAFVTNFGPFTSLNVPTPGSIGTVSTIDVKTRAKDPTDIVVGPGAVGLAITPDGKTAFVANRSGDTVSTIDVKTRTKNPTDIPVGANPNGVAVTSDGKTAFVTNLTSGTVSTIDVKTRKKDPTDIPVGTQPLGVAITSCRR